MQLTVVGLQVAPLVASDGSRVGEEFVAVLALVRACSCAWKRIVQLLTKVWRTKSNLCF